jgi:hypothetical protein
MCLDNFKAPPPQKQTVNRALKNSFSFGSTQTLGRTKTNEGSSIRSRPSDASSLTLLGSDALSIDSNITESPRAAHDSKKKPGFLNLLKRARSLSRLTGASSSRLDLASSVDYSVPPLPSPDPTLAHPPPSPPATSHSIKMRGRKSSKKKDFDTLAPFSAEKGMEYYLDRDIGNMEGIINTDLPDFNTSLPNPDPNSPGSLLGMSTDSSALSSDVSSVYHHHPSTLSSSPPSGPSFTYPFQPDNSSLKRKIGSNNYHFDKRLSPTTPAPWPPGVPPPGQEAAWTAPESWEVEKGEETMGGSGSEIDDHAYARNSSGRAQKKKRRATMSMDGRFKIRVYRANNTYHLAQLSLADTVQQMIPLLNQKLKLPDRETHKLYLKERGRGQFMPG